MNIRIASTQYSDAGRSTRRVRLGDILDYEQPTKYLVESTDYSDKHPTPVLTAGKSFILGYTNETHGIYAGPFPVIIFDDFTTSLHLVDFPFKVKSSAIKILRPCDPNVSLSLVIELMRRIGFQPGDHKRHWISEFQDFEIDLPVGEYHDFVAQAIASSDSKVRALKAKKSALEDYRRGLMHKLFSQEIRFTREDKSPFPEWKRCLLGEIATFYKGKGISKADIIEGGKTPCIRYGEIYTLYSERITAVSSHTNQPVGNLILSQAGDVITPASGEDRLDMAHACCVFENGVALGGDLNIIRSPINGAFLAYYLNHTQRKAFASLGQGNSVVHIYPRHLMTLSIAIPEKKEQEKIVSAITCIEDKIEQVRHQICSVEDFKNGLLQKLFG